MITPEMLVKTGKWHHETATLGISANFKCEYCGLDFLESPENYKLWQVDHIIPKRAGGTDALNNKAVACRQCNMDFKSKWNPVETTKTLSREELIERVRAYIKYKKSITQKEIDHIKSMSPNRSVIPPS